MDLSYSSSFLNKGVHEDGEEKSIGETEEDYLDQILGAPKRFNYDELKIITEDFSKRLGEVDLALFMKGL